MTGERLRLLRNKKGFTQVKVQMLTEIADEEITIFVLNIRHRKDTVTTYSS